MIDKIKIAGLEYTIELIKDLGRDSSCLGQCCGNSSLIQIDQDLDEQRKKKVLLHELIEAIKFEYDLPIEHHIVILLETALFDVLENNKRLFKFEIEQAEKDEIKI